MCSSGVSELLPFGPQDYRQEQQEQQESMELLSPDAERRRMSSAVEGSMAQPVSRHRIGANSLEAFPEPSPRSSAENLFQFSPDINVVNPEPQPSMHCPFF